MEFEIELGESKSLEKPSDRFVIKFDKEVQRQIDRYATTDTNRELGGVLLGKVEERAEGQTLFVSGMLTAEKTTADRTSLTFTHDTWAQIHQDKEAFFPEEKIVGWFHTHPGFGIFLSKYDLFIHENFFNLPWQIAYVVDPVQKKCGFYRWEQDRIVATDYTSFSSQKLMVSKAEKPIKDNSISQKSTVEEPMKKYATKEKKLIAALSISIALLLVTNMHRLDSDASVDKAMNEPQDEKIKGLHEVIRDYQTDIEEIQKKVSQLEKQVESYTEDRLFFYTVQEGDNLWSISRQFYDNPFEYQYLMRLNHLENPDSLEIGQRLLLYHPMGE
ncbi:LysM peptidoglycan-binding domain-containing protein [Tindallia californiensis]|uniref:Proteasome lid subunit RPN8/RPN11, contains Jab1/MPN metalloenzyme (JAMM) motif n=1 Tax=Tindallia californiensis TaxID=159292 RepID=A0A1H3KJ93_9FIRM|nr:LysM peptidoglycan-binding domain-containing protein [Tindallia californiensis]SDY52193.1 Proteasome lid subunit RPN8/RPN11, contains Jab1/MPN metalloenzyme (JAMM) motif [Tindallia californiensis]